MTKVPFDGRIVMIGFGAVGHCTMPILLRHLDMPAGRITVIDAEDHGKAIAPYRDRGVRYVLHPVTFGNMEKVLGAHAGPGDILLNLSVDVGSIDVMDWCRRNGVRYLDASIEPWGHYYANPDVPIDERTNYYLRHMALTAARYWPDGSPTAIVTHGANPGLISHFVKAGLLEVARGLGFAETPESREDWANLAQKVGLKVIHVAEHDTQVSSRPKEPDEFVNTWSVPGFWGEGSQPSELGWGTHEKRLPPDARVHGEGSGCAIYLTRPGFATEVYSWTPLGGPMIGFCVTHGESISLSDYLTVWKGGRAVYRPTVHYAYHPCNDAVLSVREYRMRNWQVQPKARILGEDIVDGIDELGALLMGDFGALWYGSQLSIHEARQILGKEFNATAIQVAAPIVAAVLWMLENPNRGLVEPEGLDHQFILDFCKPYLGPVVAVRTDWTPLKNRSTLFYEPGLDYRDPWQFHNFRVR